MLYLRRLIPLVGGAFAALILACFLFVNFAGADTASSWLGPAGLNLQKQADLSVIPPSINGNIDCFAEDNGVCAFNTLYGSANTTGSVRLNHSQDYRPIVSYIDNRQHFIAVPNSSTFITYTTEPVYGLYLYFNYNFLNSIKLTNNGLGAYYQIKNPPDGKLADKDNHRLAADYASMSFSENGRWMVVSEPNVAMLRVNLQTFEVLPFAPGFNYTIGLNPSPQTAITNDGRYAVVASKDFNRFSIYDLSTCSAVPSTINGAATCQSRDLQQFMTKQVSGFTNASNLRFISDDMLGLYVSYTENSVHKTAKYILSTSGGTIHQLDYLALGDSYISGEGAFQYLPGTDTSDNHCHVSLVSYPLLIGQDLNYNSYHSVTCSGATTNDIINTSDTYKGQAKPEKTRQQRVSEIPSILSNFQPGYIDQLDFVKQYQPRAITVSISGNDVGMISKLKSCIKPGTCFSSYEDRLEFVIDVNKTFPKLVSTYTKIKNAGPPDMRVYAIGYPQIAEPGGDCALNVHLDNDEIIFTTQAIDYLNALIKAATARAGVFYTDTEDAFYGHRFCEAGPGSVAMNGITAGNDIPTRLGGPIGSESYHPNEFGYQLMENKILDVTHNMTNPMPDPDTSAALPAQNSLEILDAPHSGRQINTVEYDNNIAPDLAYQQVPVDISIDGASHSLAPGTALQAQLHSDPLSLGGFITDSDGNISAQIAFPPSAPAGYHSLHFYGTDAAGQPIDIYKDIYIAHTADDLDGNGIADSLQKCIGVEPSGQDYDRDGIDDACDPTITLPPSPSPGQPTVRLSGSLSSTGSGLIIVSSSPTAPNPTVDSDIQTASISSASVSSSPKVLGANTASQPKSAKANSDLKIPSKDYVIAGIGFLSLVTSSYGLKNWLL